MEIDLLGQMQKIHAYERGHWAFQVIQTGLRFGLLQALNDSPDGYTPEALSVHLMLHEPFLLIWCRTAYHFELLDVDPSGRFRLQPHLDQALGLDAFSSPFGGQGRVRSEEGFPLFQENDPFSLFVRTGKPVGRPSWRDIMGRRFPATRNLIVLFDSKVFPEGRTLEKRLHEGCRLLEIGCGGGDLLLALARRYPKSRFVGVDPDESAVGEAEEAAESLGLSERLSFLPQGGEETDFIEAFDVVLMVLTLHEIRPDLRPQILAKAFQAMKPGGDLCIIDYPYPGHLEDFRNPRFEYGIIEQYFEAPYGIIHLPAEEQERLLKLTGFQDIKRCFLGEGEKLDGIFARK